jgi:hypothetical protein
LVSNAVSDEIGIEEEESAAAAAAVSRLPSQGRASGDGGRPRFRNRRDAEDARQIGDRTRGFERHLASFSTIVEGWRDTIRQPVQRSFGELADEFARVDLMLQNATDERSIAVYTTALNGISLEMNERMRLVAPIPAPPASPQQGEE